MKKGWIKIQRSIEDHWIWEDSIKLKWWMDIILNVNHSNKKVLIGSTLIDCNRGQCVRSLKGWADRWKTSKDSTRNFLNLLAKDGMILHESLGKTTRITVCNYDDYQDDLHDSQTISQRQPNDNQTITKRQLYTNKNGKNDKNEKKDNKILFDHFILLFNESTGKNYQGDKKARSSFNARISEGYTLEKIIIAIKNASKDKYLTENNYLTPNYILQSDKLQKWLNVLPTTPKIPVFQNTWR